MRFSTTAIFFIIFILIFSIFVANLANIVSVDKEILKKLNKTKDNGDTHQKKTLQIDDKNDHLMWFVQISDIHISIFTDAERIEQFKKFVANTIDIIKPTVVLASGDLTDARGPDRLGSQQYIKEWEIYSGVLKSNNISQKLTWLDIRGNHDYFNVPDIDSPLNYFKTHSVQGKNNHSRSYLHQVKIGTERYSFIAVDACLEPGPKRPFNFIGLLDAHDMSYLIDLHEEAQRQGGNYTIWFGHYPTSCILSPGSGHGGIRGIIGKFDDSYAYLCGHLHTQGGLVPNMYTMQKLGFLELELGDWKSNRLFRVAAFDHGLFSFVDIHYDEWPIILITNPKHALFNIPNKENPSLQLESTHIRMLVFSPSKVVSCEVRVANQNESWKKCKQVSENLFVAPWSPEKYRIGIHNLEVIIATEDGRSTHVTQPFSLDESRLNFNLFARFVLMGDACKLFQALFGLSLAFCIVPLCIMRIIHELVIAGKCKKPRIKWAWFRNFIRRLWILSSVDRILIPLLAYFVYVSVGPWSIGEIIDGHMGIVFVWGIFVNNAFIPGSLTYLYGFFQLTFCQLPLIFVYADGVNARFKSFVGIKNDRQKLTKFFIYFPFAVIVSIELVLALYFWWVYGFVAFILGPFRTWSVIFNLVLWYIAINIPEKSLRSAMTVWNTRNSISNSDILL